MHEPRANRWRKRDPELRARHRAGNGPIHLATRGDVIPICKERITSGASIEVLVVLRDEIKDGKLSGWHWGAQDIAGTDFDGKRGSTHRYTPQRAVLQPKAHGTRTMLQQLLEPIFFAQCITSLFLAVLFLQSGIDKVVDYRGNQSWLIGHFAKSPLRSQVNFMLPVITLAEVAAGIFALLGAIELLRSGDRTFALYGAELAALDILMLFFGQRIAKEYAGAAALVPYFILCIIAIVLFSK